MTKISRFAKYQLANYTTTVLVFYGIVLFLVLLTYSPGSGNTISGTGIFLFVLGLNWFKASFRFSQANNLPRRVYYFGTVSAILAMALVLSLVDIALSMLLSTGMEIGLFRQVYPLNFFWQLLWTWTSFTASASVGWMISMLYYRSNLALKIAISLSPAAVFWLFDQIHRRSGGTFFFSFVDFLKRIFGVAGEVPDPRPAVLTFSILTLLFWASSAALMQRAPVKN